MSNAAAPLAMSDAIGGAGTRLARAGSPPSLPDNHGSDTSVPWLRSAFRLLSWRHLFAFAPFG